MQPSKAEEKTTLPLVYIGQRPAVLANKTDHKEAPFSAVALTAARVPLLRTDGTCKLLKTFRDFVYVFFFFACSL